MRVFDFWRAPDFWRGSPAHPVARLLAPLGAVHGAIAGGRLVRPGLSAALPTIAIGGPTLGGDGKTPLALAVAARLAAMGERPAFLTRGYGRRRGGLPEPFRVDPARHGAREAGDEPLLLARAATTIVGADRGRAAKLAQELGATVLVLDDGLHGRHLAPDLALLAIDADYGAGNGLCPPAGPLRAPLAATLDAAQAAVVIGEGTPGAAVAARLEAAGKPMLRARLVIDARAAARLRGERLLAFAGIARPEKFLRGLTEIGAEVVATRWFADHYFFNPRDLEALEREARRLDARLVTTEKDAARIDPRAAMGIETAPVDLAFDCPEAIDALLARTLEQARAIRERVGLNICFREDFRMPPGARGRFAVFTPLMRSSAYAIYSTWRPLNLSKAKNSRWMTARRFKSKSGGCQSPRRNGRMV